MTLRFVSFVHKDANFRINADALVPAQENIIQQRDLLEKYIAGHPGFTDALTPVGVASCAPEIVQRMARAAKTAGKVGPMAAVAGTVAQLAAEAACGVGVSNVIVENGGDIFLCGNHDYCIALFAGENNPFGSKLALQVKKEHLPLAICSSSSKMGHSLSFGCCDLATVISPDAALADAVATQACNEVKNADDISGVLERVVSIPGIHGVILIKDDQIGMQGIHLPELIKNSDVTTRNKITIDSAGNSNVCGAGSAVDR